MLRRAVGIEMEGHGVFQAALETPVDYRPIPMLIKSVCDHGNNEKSDDYHELAGFTSAYFFLLSLKNNEIKPQKNLPQFSFADFIPLGYAPRNNYYEEMVKSAEKKFGIRIISITGNSDLKSPEYSDDKKYLSYAREKGINFKVIVVNPNGLEAYFRNDIESPDAESIEKTILFTGANSLKKSLEDYWANYKHIEARYSRVGLQFKLWLTDKNALIEPYHIGREDKKCRGGLCGFSQVFYTKYDREYKILKDHFENLWKRSDPFWPKSNGYVWNIDDVKKADIIKLVE